MYSKELSRGNKDVRGVASCTLEMGIETKTLYCQRPVKQSVRGIAIYIFFNITTGS